MEASWLQPGLSAYLAHPSHEPAHSQPLILSQRATDIHARELALLMQLREPSDDFYGCSRKRFETNRFDEHPALTVAFRIGEPFRLLRARLRRDWLAGSIPAASTFRPISRDFLFLRGE
jgi:hypothetical protein